MEVCFLKDHKNKWKSFLKKHKVSIIASVITILFLSIFLNSADPPHKEITYQEFQTMLEEKKIESAVINKSEEKVYIKDTDEKLYVTESPSYEEFKKDLMEQGVKVNVQKPPQWSAIISSLISLLIYGGLFFIIYRSLNVGRTKKIDNPAVIPDTKFSDIAGYSEQKEDLKTYVEYLKNPEKFSKHGANMPKGVLLYGPPGTGKTLFARAIAGEAGVPFFSVSGSDFIEMFVGVGAKRVRDLFANAREKAPSIIFIDEIDAIGGKRTGYTTGSSEHTQTIEALLTEMDGFDKDSGVLVIATTNLPENLDNALTRSGRFDSHIAIPLPQTSEDREQIINIHKRNRKFAKDVDFKLLAKQWIGFSGADIESVMNESVIIAVNKGLDEITKECLDEAFYKKILKGHVKKDGQSERAKEELELVAYHEAGHALARTLLQIGEISKVTILATTNGAGGVTFNVPKTMGLFSMEELEAEVQVLYAGRAAEYLLYNKEFQKVTTGASNDIERATEIIRGMVMNYGLQRKPILMNFDQVPKGESYTFEEMKALSEELFQKTVDLLEEHFELLQIVASRLLEKETIEADELKDIVDQYLNEKEKCVS